MKNIQFIDLQAQRAYLGTRIDAAMARVLEHGKFIMGPEVKAFEEKLSAFGGLAHAVSCSNGTDAITLPLMAWGIGPGDAVFVPSFTFAATAEVVALAGATPVFVDIRPDTFNMDAEHLEVAIRGILEAGELKPRAIIAVDLFGQIADYPALRGVADRHGLKLVADAAQGFGATLDGKQAGHWADAVTTSFFPAKPLGCYGDGGAVLTDDEELCSLMQSIRVHGKGTDKYDNVRIGLNARLDTLQAAILLEKLDIFAEEIQKRNAIAARYEKELGDVVETPFVPSGMVSTWAQYTLKVQNRDQVQVGLKDAGVPSVVYYPKPLHQQTAYRNFPRGGNGLPVSDRLAGQVLSLPMHPYMDEETQGHIIASVRKCAGQQTAE